MKAKRQHAPSGADQSAVLPRLIEGGVDAAPLDRIIHQPVRLSIVSSLAVNEALSFNELKRLLELSDGNLSVHARRLEDAGYVTCDKKFVGRVPRTRYRLTDSGRQALQRYLEHMEALIAAVRQS
ncbi:MAG TPA: transcriptional regulator [Acidobacteriota bacterium]|nr:transcriptional regulator [Acidobacteriota bacterium]